MSADKFHLKAREEYDKQAGVAIVHIEDAQSALEIMKEKAYKMKKYEDASFINFIIEELEEIEEKVHSVR